MSEKKGEEKDRESLLEKLSEFLDDYSASKEAAKEVETIPVKKPAPRNEEGPDQEGVGTETIEEKKPDFLGWLFGGK